MNSVLKNFSYLTILQALTVLAPLLTYPFLIRVIGDELFGQIIWSYAIVQFFVVLINFGFNITGTKHITESNSDSEKREIISSIYYIKFGLFILGLIILLMLCFVFENFREAWIILLLSYLITLGEVLVPVWFFQGIEKMKFITLVNGGAKVMSTVSIFAFVKNENDYLLVPIFQGLFSVGAGVISFLILRSILKSPFIFVKLKILKRYFVEGFQFLVSRISSVVIERVNILIIQSFFGYAEVTYYDFATKIVNLVKIPYDLLNQALYPYVIRTKNMLLVRNVIFGILFTGAIVIGAVYWQGEFIFELVAGSQSLLGSEVLKTLIWVAPITGVGFFLGNTSLVLFGFNKEFNLSIIWAMVLYLTLVFLTYKMETITIQSLSQIYLFITVFWVGYRLIYVLKYKILK